MYICYIIKCENFGVFVFFISKKLYMFDLFWYLILYFGIVNDISERIDIDEDSVSIISDYYFFIDLEEFIYCCFLDKFDW